MTILSSQNPVLTLLPNLLLILAVATGIIITEPPLTNDRKLRPTQDVEEKDKNPNSYFWEDPLKGIPSPKKIADSEIKIPSAFQLRWGAEISFGNPSKSSPAKDATKAAPAEKKKDLKFSKWIKDESCIEMENGMVILVGMEGGSNPADLERRIRTRLAVASALSGRVGLLKCPKMGITKWAFNGQDEQKQRMRYSVAVECFASPSVSLRSTGARLKHSAVAVVYLDESLIEPSPTMMKTLGDQFGDSGATVSYIGISRSVHLRDFLLKSTANSIPETPSPDQSRIRIYSAHATVDDTLLDLPKEIRNRVKTANASFLGPKYWFGMEGGYGLLTRVGADDGELASALVAELANRGIPQEPQDAVLLLADMDRYHSRVLVKSFENKFKPAHKQNFPFDLTKSVRVIHYPEALDALGLAQASSPAGQTGNSSSQGKTGSQNQGNAASRGNPGGVHAAEGYIQFDSLARLPARIRELEQEDNVRYRAIGLFGSDVHDKLQILRALRLGLPQALFFTNDLDARLWQGENRGESINLVVAGAFGLSMNSEIQGSVAPFRSSYQTATYLACLHAVGYSPAGSSGNWLENGLIKGMKVNESGKEIKGLRREVEIHEVGRTGDQLVAFHELPTDKKKGGMMEVAPGRAVSVQRDSPSEITAQRFFHMVIVILLLVILWQLWAPIVRDRWAGAVLEKEERESIPKWVLWTSTFLVVFLCSLAWNVGALFGSDDGTNEGGALFAGVNAKPVIAANFLIIAVGLVMIIVQFRSHLYVYPYPFRKARLSKKPEETSALAVSDPIPGDVADFTENGSKKYADPENSDTKESADGLPGLKFLPSILDINGWLEGLGDYLWQKLRGRLPSGIRPRWSELLEFIRQHQKERREPIIKELDKESTLIWAYARERLAVTDLNIIWRLMLFILLGYAAYYLMIGSSGTDGGPPSSIRGNGFRDAYGCGDLFVKIILVSLAGLACDRQLTLLVGLDKLVRFFERRSFWEEDKNEEVLPPPYNWYRRPEIEDNSNEKEAKEKYGIEDAGHVGFWEMPLLRTAAMRFSEVTPCMVMPFVLAFLILVSRHPVFENISFPAAELTLFGFILLAPLTAGLLVQYNMARVFTATKRRLRRAQRFVSLTAINDEREKFLKNEMDSLDELEKRTQYGFIGNPIFEAILLPLGGYGILQFSSALATFFR